MRRRNWAIVVQARSVALEQFDHSLRGNSLAAQKTLKLVAAKLFQELGLLWACSTVSTPSVMIVIPSVLPIAMIASAKALSSLLSARSRMNEGRP